MTKKKPLADGKTIQFQFITQSVAGVEGRADKQATAGNCSDDGREIPDSQTRACNHHHTK
jgi:hypothetical protein